MSAALPQNPDGNCCLPVCDDEVIVQVPGPKGDDGTDGTDGEDGISAFTLTDAQFAMPAEGANVTVTTTTPTTFLTPTQIVYVQTAGWMSVVSVGTNSVVLKNEENTATGVYTDNVAPATVIAAGVKITAGGKQGPTGGTPAGTAFAIANNLSEGNAATIRTNLGLVIGANVQAYDADLSTYAGISPSANVQSVLGAANYAAIRTLLALVPGTDIQAFDTFLLSIAALGTAADKMIYTTAANTAAEADITAAGRALLDDATAQAQRITLGGVLPRYGLLGSLIGADMNTTGDQAIAIESGVTKYIIRRIVVTNASINLTTAAGGIYTNAAKAGTVIVAAAQVYSALTAAAKFKDLTLEAIVGTDILTATTIYFSLTTAQGAAATANVYIFGENVT